MIKKKKKKYCGKLRIQYIKCLGFQLGIWPERRSTYGLYTYFSNSIMIPLFLFFFLLSTLPVSVPNLLCNEVTQGLGTSLEQTTNPHRLLQWGDSWL